MGTKVPKTSKYNKGVVMTSKSTSNLDSTAKLHVVPEHLKSHQQVLIEGMAVVHTDIPTTNPPTSKSN